MSHEKRSPARFRCTSIAVYYYHRRYTLSFSWRGRWRNRPEFLRDTVNGGWTLVCGPLILEKDVWPEGDDWGSDTQELRGGILEDLFAAITGEGESVWRDLFTDEEGASDES